MLAGVNAGVTLSAAKRLDSRPFASLRVTWVLAVSSPPGTVRPDSRQRAGYRLPDHRRHQDQHRVFTSARGAARTCSAGK